MMLRWLCCAGLAAIVLAQGSTPTSAPLSTSAVKTESATSTTLGASTSPEFPTSNSTTSTSSSLYLWVPQLIACERATLAFRGPPVSKTVGVYSTNTSTFLEILPLGGEFTPLTLATFSWLVDIPPGASVNVQIFASYSGRTISFTSEPIIVKPGTNTKCLATNEGQNTFSIVSLATSLDPSYSHVPSGQSEPSRTPVAAIAGGVVGGIGAITISLLGLFFLRRRQRRRLTAQNLEMASKEETRPTLRGQPSSYYSGQTLIERPSAHYPEPMISPPALSPRTEGSSYGEMPMSPGTEGLDDPRHFTERSQRGFGVAR